MKGSKKMSQNKKNWLVLVVLVVLPLAIVFPSLINAETIFDYKSNKFILYAFAWLPIFANTFMLIANYKNTNKSSWNIIYTLMLLISIYILYSLYSLSHFGF